MQHRSTTIVIPVWNLWEMTRNCLLSIKEHTPAGLARVLVVDNGSTDATVQELESTGAQLFGPDFSALRLPENLGFARACNLGAKTAQTPYLLFLNNDTLATENWLPPLVAELERDEALGGVGPLLTYPMNNLTQHCGIVLTPGMLLSHIYAFFPHQHPVVRKKRRLQAITAAALLMRREAFLGCDGFFEGFKNGFEDVDLCARLHAAGKYFTCVAQSVVHHLESRTPGRKDNNDENSSLLRQRSKNLLAPDLIRIATDDDFIAKLNPVLTCILRLPSALEQELTHAFRPQDSVLADPAACWAALQANPLWQAGYGLLIRFLEQSDKLPSAYELAQLEVNFFPNPMSLERLRNLALRLEDADTAAIASHHLGYWMGLAKDPEALISRAQEQAEWAKTNNYDDVYAVYKEWLDARGIRM